MIYSGSPGSGDPPAGALVVRTCAGDRKVDIEDMFDARHIHDIIFAFGEKQSYLPDEFPRQRPPGQLVETITLSFEVVGCMAP